MLYKIFSILLIPLVLVCTSGGVLYVEECPMMKTPTYSLVGGKQCCCSKSSHNKCCKETKVVIKKIKDDYFSSASASIPLNKSLLCIFHEFFLIPLSGILVSSHIFSLDYPPPNISSVSIPVKYRSLLI